MVLEGFGVLELAMYQGVFEMNCGIWEVVRSVALAFREVF